MEEVPNVVYMLFGVLNLLNYIPIVCYSYGYVPARDLWMGELNIVAGLLDCISFYDNIFWYAKSATLLIESVKMIWVCTHMFPKNKRVRYETTQVRVSLPAFIWTRNILSIFLLAVSMFVPKSEWRTLLMFASRCYQAFLINMLDGYLREYI